MYKRQPWDHVSLYANYIEGLTTGPIAPAGTSNAGEIFAPIKTKQVEAGVKVDFGSVTTTLGLFQIKQPAGLTTFSAVSYTHLKCFRSRLTASAAWCSFSPRYPV